MTDDFTATQLPTKKTVPLRRAVGTIEGPAPTNAADSGSRPMTNLESYALSPDRVMCAGRSASTYPRRADGTRDGDPIADYFIANVHQNGAIVAIADGCNWGVRPRDAATAAARGFVDHIKGQKGSLTTLLELTHMVQRAFNTAHERIIAPFIAAKRDIFEACTTTLLGGALVEVVRPEGSDKKREWAFVCANVGECRAFHWSKRTGHVVDITTGSRNNVENERDPGGRLGPYVKNGEPDLRNFKLYYLPCEEGDVILLTTDGVYENFDPKVLGVTPNDLTIPAPTWADVEASQDTAMKTARSMFMRMSLKSLISSVATDGEGRADNIVSRVVGHCVDVTKKARDFMERFPSKRLPEDYSQYPGKMDHSTALALVVGDYENASAAEKRLERGRWEWRVWFPLSPGGGDTFDIWQQLISKNAQIASVVDKTPLESTSTVYLNLFRNDVCLRYRGQTKAGGAFDVDVRQARDDDANMENWFTAGQLFVNDDDNKDITQQRLCEIIGDELPAANVKDAASALGRAVPRADVLEVRATTRRVPYAAFGSVFKILSGDMALQQSDIEVFGSDNRSLGRWRSVALLSSKPTYLQEFVKLNIVLGPNFLNMSTADFLGFLRRRT